MHHIPVTEVKRHLRMFECLNPAFVNLQDHPSDSDAGWEVDSPATELTAFSGYFRLCPGMCNPIVTPQTFLLHVAFPLTQAQGGQGPGRLPVGIQAPKETQIWNLASG